MCHFKFNNEDESSMLFTKKYFPLAFYLFSIISFEKLKYFPAFLLKTNLSVIRQNGES